MQHPSRLVLIKHTGSAVLETQPAAQAEPHWHTVLGERPRPSLPDDDLDYFLRRPQAPASHAALRAMSHPAPRATPHPAADAMAMAFAH